MVDALSPIDTSAPPSNIPQQSHPLQPPNKDGDTPIPTNKFYTNMLLDNRQLPAWTHPYSVWMARSDAFFGLAVSQTRADQRVFGPEGKVPPQYFLNPAGIHSAVLSAREFTKDNISLNLKDMGHLSVTASVGNGSGSLTAPLVNGIGLITATYNGQLTPQIQSQVGFRSVNQSQSPGLGIGKYSLQLNDNTTWVMYVIPPPSGGSIQFSANGGNLLVADRSLDGVVIQIGSCPNESDYDQCAGAYAKSASLSAGVDGDVGNYSIMYEVGGKSTSGNLLLYALPHQVEAFTSDMKSKQLGSRLDSTVMGQMTAVASTSLDMQESLPNRIGFLPWAEFANKSDSEFTVTPTLNSVMDALRSVAQAEAGQDVTGQSSLDSMYFSGKGLDKFALCLVVIKYIVKDDGLAKTLLSKLQDAFKIFVENRQQNPLAYDTTWKGLVSVAGLKGDPNADFGNSFYNDHHFHYGYFIHAAAVIGKVDRDFGGNWIDQNKSYVNALLRDYANPSADDKFFPQFRSFDWFSGHSWAKGLFLSGDGKDEESSSEDYHSIYGMKLWGQVIGDTSMEARANLMIAIERRAINMYMLYGDSNRVVPKQFLPNRVSGILFENKVDHATYFGLNPEFIHGIHMIPVTPISSFVRGPEFCKQEWDSKLKDLVNSVDSGWKGILQSNHALFDPQAAVNFFKDPEFKPQWLDGGMSHAWCLAFSAGITT